MHSITNREFKVLRSHDMGSDEFSTLFTQMFGSLYADLPPLAKGITIGGVYGRFAGMSIRRLQYGGDFSITLPSPQDEITFMLPTSGKVIIEHRGESIGCVNVGLAIDKRDIRAMRFAQNHAQYGMSIHRGLITKRLSRLLGKPLMRPVRFAQEIDPTQPALQGIRALLELATDTRLDTLLNSGALVPNRMQEMIVDAVLEAWPNNYSEALRNPLPGLAPRHVKLAMAYLQNHPTRLVSGVELAVLSNVSLRTLQNGFRQFAGTSIVAYQRQVRLESARQMLARAQGRSVAEVALHHGFSHAGRFTQYFQQAFGVSPTEVRRSGLQKLTPNTVAGIGDQNA